MANLNVAWLGAYFNGLLEAAQRLYAAMYLRTALA